VELESSNNCDMDVATDGVRESEVGRLSDEIQNLVGPTERIWMCRLGRSEAGSRSAAAGVAPLISLPLRHGYSEQYVGSFTGTATLGAVT
jgi:hypothetical protein